MALTDEPIYRYDPTTILFHWFTVVSVVLLWIIGQTADWLPHGTIKSAVWSTHVVWGFVLAIALIGRLVWRAAFGLKLPPANKGVLQFLAKTVHYLLYAALTVVIALGIVNAFVRGYHLFGLLSLPQLGNRDLRAPITDWHGLFANILLGLAVLHAAAALMHHYIMRDMVLRRMLFGPPVS